MLILIVAFIVLAVACGFLWHDQPGNENNCAVDDDNHRNELRPELGLKSPSIPASIHIFPVGPGVCGESDATQANGSTDPTPARIKGKTQANPINP